MTLHHYLKKIEEAQRAPETCSLPEDEGCEEFFSFNPAEFSVALVRLMCFTNPGQFGYIQQLAAAPHLEVGVARDALNMLKPNSGAARSAWDAVVAAIPEYWIERDEGSPRIVWPPERAHSDKEWRDHLADVARKDDEAQSPWG